MKMIYLIHKNAWINLATITVVEKQEDHDLIYTTDGNNWKIKGEDRITLSNALMELQ